MLTDNPSTKSRIRSALADSHVSTIALAVLLVWSVDLLFRGLWRPLVSAAVYVVTAIAIRGIPYSSGKLTGHDLFFLVWMFSDIAKASVTVFAACLVSRWVHGVGPICAMASDLQEFRRERTHA